MDVHGVSFSSLRLYSYTINYNSLCKSVIKEFHRNTTNLTSVLIISASFSIVFREDTRLLLNSQPRIMQF